MDHLARTPLLLEFATVSAQRRQGNPWAAPKSRTRRLSRTSASMPDSRGEGKILRRLDPDDKARKSHPSLSRRRAQRDHRERRSKPDQGHLAPRSNPNARSTAVKRGNPNWGAKGKTQVRVSPSKQQKRPPLAPIKLLHDKKSLLKGNRI